MDEVTGANKSTLPAQSTPVSIRVKTAQSGEERVILHAQNILRPQLKFADKPDNSNTRFIRRIAVKHNAKRPLDDGMPSSGQLTPEMIQHIKTLGITDATSSDFMYVKLLIDSNRKINCF